VPKRVRVMQALNRIWKTRFQIEKGGTGRGGREGAMGRGGECLGGIGEDEVRHVDDPDLQRSHGILRSTQESDAYGMATLRALVRACSG
jgi:hypothetical protein